MTTSGDNMLSNFPVKSKQKTYNINDVKTEFVVTEYSDKLLVVVTQYEKMGTMVQINKEIVLDEMQESSTVYNTKVLLGKDEPLTHVIAKILTSGIKTNKQIILTMALKNSSPESVKLLKSLVEECVSS